MTLYTPLYLQAGEYSARQDRQILDALFEEGILSIDDDHLRVRERALGPTFDVEIDAGKAFVRGDTEANQGIYFVWSDDVETVTIPPAPVADSRIDLVILEIQDDQVDASGQNRARIRVVEGVAAAAPVAPATPGSSIPLAQVTVTAATVAITDAEISDVRSPSSAATYTTTSRIEVMTQAERDAIAAPYDGQTIVNTTVGEVQVYRAGSWLSAGGGGLTVGILADRPAADGTRGFYFATDKRALYADTGSWIVAGVLVDSTLTMPDLSGMDVVLTYSGDNLSTVTYNNQAGTRRALATLAYTGDTLTSVTTDFYADDGVTVVATWVETLTYTGDNVTAVERTIA